MDNLMLVFIVVGFLAVVLMIEGGYLLWNSSRGAEAQRIRRRLQLLSAGSALSEESEFVRERLLSRSPAIERMLHGIPNVRKFDRWLAQSGLSVTVGGVLGACAAAAAVTLLLWAFLPIPGWIAPFAMAATALVPIFYVMRVRQNRLDTLERQLPDTLELMARAMRAGHAFPSALQMAGDEGPEPLAQEFRIAFDEINYGIVLQDALTNLAARVPVADLRFFVIAVAVQRETGGNLAELLQKLASLMRARFALLGQVRVLATEGRWSAWILSLLPFVLLGAINAINPKFMSILWRDPAGVMTSTIGLSAMLIGIVWMWRIIKIRV